MFSTFSGFHSENPIKLDQKVQVLQGPLHYTPEHCLINGGFPLLWWTKPCFKWANMYLLRSPDKVLTSLASICLSHLERKTTTYVVPSKTNRGHIFVSASGSHLAASFLLWWEKKRHVSTGWQHGDFFFGAPSSRFGTAAKRRQGSWSEKPQSCQDGTLPWAWCSFLRQLKITPGGCQT